MFVLGSFTTPKKGGGEGHDASEKYEIMENYRSTPRAPDSELWKSQISSFLVFFFLKETGARIPPTGNKNIIF